MRHIFLAFLFLSCGFFQLSAQLNFSTEHIGRSKHRDVNNKETGGSGDAVIFSGNAQLPFAVKIQEDNRIKAWMISLGSSYTKFNNNELMAGRSPEEIFNNRVGVMYLRPVKEKWSMLLSVGAGIYSAHTNIGSTRFDEVLFDGAVLFLWHLRHNLDVGFGVAINSSFGYPMGFPALYLKWTTSGRYFVNIQMVDGMNVSTGVHLNDNIDLGVCVDMNGSLALQKINGKKMMFSHTYMTVAFQPEFRIGKHVTIPVSAGLSVMRNAYYEERTLKAFFSGYGRDYDPHFNTAPYFAASVRISF